jgi:hypothetical protein
VWERINTSIEYFATITAEISKIKSECGDRELDSVLRETEAELQKAQVQFIALFRVTPFIHRLLHAC